jgi:hypothetical protein
VTPVGSPHRTFVCDLVLVVWKLFRIWRFEFRISPDGHLRRDLDPDMEVDVEILDVTEEEAREVLLSKGSRDYLV